MTEQQGTQPAGERVRPPVHRWLWYALGGSLPARHSTWVLHDTTTRTWGLRHVARSLVQMAIPTAVVLAVVPAGWALRLAVVAGGVFLGLIFSLAYMAETTEQRVIKAGYRPGTAVHARERASIEAQRAESARKRAAAAKRAARYRQRTGGRPG
ncbi:hypothetical protein SAMN03159343_3052 [Klenkia marina]|uniref:DUF5313 domain-containing protein n=1 Tax=Klenkia marina TaxID=1960309 RepID=A0A1G4YLC1_9ACTN|nr:DUF5313 family protein [Klenkia marina]SCX54286.1 hypothetical protein SAMN03159343_3052 [Klenkia marina]